MVPILRDVIHRMAAGIVTGTLFLGPVGLAAMGELVSPDLSSAVPEMVSFHEVEPVTVSLPMDFAVDDSEEPVMPAKLEVAGDASDDRNRGARRSRPLDAGVRKPSIKPGSIGGSVLGKRTRPGHEKGVARGTSSNKPSGRSTSRCTKEYEGVEDRGDNHYAVSRDFIDQYASIGKVRQLGWTARHQGSDGKPDGFRVGGFGCNGVLHHVGLRRGDVVHSINGHKVTSIPGALMTYLKVKNDRNVVVLVSRKGQKMRLRYEVS